MYLALLPCPHFQHEGPLPLCGSDSGHLIPSESPYVFVYCDSTKIHICTQEEMKKGLSPLSFPSWLRGMFSGLFPDGDECSACEVPPDTSP